MEKDSQVTDEIKASRTSELKKAVALGVSQWGRDAAREMVPAWACAEGNRDNDLRWPTREPTIASLARAIDVSHNAMTLCLGGQRPGYKTRTKLEEYLGLTIGGMTDVLSVISKLQGSGE